jgi:hypothetical protein
MVASSALEEDVMPTATIDGEWNERCDDFLAGNAPGLFLRWPLLAPTLLEFSSQ